jgi:hypothetical protein
MLLAIGENNAQFINLPFNGVFLPIHGAEIEHCGSCDVALERLGHTHQNPRGQFPSQLVAQYTGRGVADRHSGAFVSGPDARKIIHVSLNAISSSGGDIEA